MRGIYIIKNKVNKKLYLGKTIHIEKRRKEHLNRLRRGKHENKYLQRAFNKYGEQNFIFDVLIKDNSLTDDELDSLEIMYIRLFNLKDSNYGYNLTYGGGGSVGYKATEEQRRKRSIKSKGKNNPFYGKKISKEQREKMNDGIRKVTKTKEYREKMSIVMKGRVFTEEHSKNKSLAQMGGKNPQARRVSVDGEIFDCVKDVAIKYGIPQNTASWRFSSTSERFKDWKYLN